MGVDPFTMHLICLKLCPGLAVGTALEIEVGGE